MQKAVTSNDLRAIVDSWRNENKRIVFVPTMGNLHAGHLHLVEQARQHGDKVVVSIFVNPMQFGKNEDFSSYPRTLDDDVNKLVSAGTDLLFTPELDDIYPRGIDQCTRIIVPELSGILCGASRPGHFTGVATVVARLFNLVRPDAAIFGEKDYQQLLVIKRMVEDLAFDIEIIGIPTVREQDGLAMSSRNSYLNPIQREQAAMFYQGLCNLKEQLLAGRRDFPSLESETSHWLEQHGFTPDYVSIRRSEDLSVPDGSEKQLQILAAAYLGKARLIDNLRVNL